MDRPAGRGPHMAGSSPPAASGGAAAAARCSRRLRRLSRWRLTWRPSSSATRLTEWLRSREASLARRVTPLRCSVASATWHSGLAGLRSFETSISNTASSLTCLAILSKRRATCSRSSSVTGRLRPLTSICMGLLSCAGCPGPGLYMPPLQRSRVGDGGDRLCAAGLQRPRAGVERGARRVDVVDQQHGRRRERDEDRLEAPGAPALHPAGADLAAPAVDPPQARRE